jgi:Nitrile hydratase, alpha chain
VDSGAIDAWIEIYRDQVGPKIGARVVARAWNDVAYKARLLADGTAAIKELGIEGWAVGHLKVVENTAHVHNLIVCTLCSCYPHALLGMQPSWYKKEAYRARAVQLGRHRRSRRSRAPSAVENRFPALRARRPSGGGHRAYSKDAPAGFHNKALAFRRSRAGPATRWVRIKRWRHAASPPFSAE